MNTIVELKSQIRNLIDMIINKERKKINKWKNVEGWYTMDANNFDYGYKNYNNNINDVDTFYHLLKKIENEGGNNNFMDYAKFIDDADPFNSKCKWRSIKKREEFFIDFHLHSLGNN